MKSKSAVSKLSVCAIFWLTLMIAVLTSAQETAAKPAVLTSPDVNYPLHFDVSRPLRDMATEVSSPAGAHVAPPVRYPKLQLLKEAAQGGQAMEDGAIQTSSGPLVSAIVGLNLLGVGNGFPGYSVPDAPTDVNLSVGDTQVLQWVNVSYAIFDKATGAVIMGPILGNAFWSGFGGACQTSNSGDIIAQWDKVAHRWVATQNVFSSPYMTCVAVSTTPDATGTYYRFAYPQPGFPDYPKWGIWSDAYYQSQNNFGTTGYTYVGAYACAYERAKMLVGDSTAKQICFQTGTYDDSLLPADLDSVGTPPPSGQQELFLGSIDNGVPYIYQYLFHVDFKTPSNSTFTGLGGSMPIAGVAHFDLACGGIEACIPQRGVSDLLDSLGDRLMYRLAYRNFSGDHQTWLVNHAVIAGSSVGERWYEFRAPENSTSLSVYQQGTFAPDSNYRFMGSIAMDSAQDIALGYSVSSSSLYPSISFTGRVPGDALGTMEAEASLVAGSGSQTDTGDRWGDYTNMAIDAADDCTFWYTNQYYMVTGTFDWSTRLASLKFPGCGGPPPPNFSISASPSSLSIAQGNQGTSTITTTISGGFNSAITLSASGVPSGTTVSFNPNPIPAPGNGSSTMTITVGAGTATGTYPITVTGNGGGIQQNTTVTLTVTAQQLPNFTISASPSSVTIQPGNQGTSTITATISGGFSSAISLSASGAPSGTTVSFNPNPIPAPGAGSSTMTIMVGSSTPTGTYPITVTGNGGGIQQNTTVNLTVTALQVYDCGFNFRGTTSYVTDEAYAVAVLGEITQQNKLNGNGIACPYFWVTSAHLGEANRSTSVDARLAGINRVNSLNTTDEFDVTLPAAGSYSIGLAFGDDTGAWGGAGTGVAFQDGLSSLFSVVLSGSATAGTFYDATGVLYTAAQWPSSNQEQSVVMSGTTLRVLLTSGPSYLAPIAHIRVTAVPNFAIAASPGSLSIAQGNQGASTITTTVSGGFNSAISLSASGAPSGTTVSFNPNPIPAPGSGNSTMTITVGSSTPPGTYPITVTGNSGGIQQNTTVTLTVTAAPNFTISASPSSLSVAQGNQGTSTITTTVSGGFNSAVSLSASGAPSGTTVSFNPNPIPAPGSGNSTITITVGSSTPTGTYPITMTGNGDGIQQNTTVTMTVTAQQLPNFTISASPSSLSVAQGNQGTSTITTTISGGFNSAISLSASGAPSGTTVSFNPNLIPAPGTGSSTMTIMVGGSTAPGTYPITVTGDGGGIQQNTTVTLTVSAAGSWQQGFDFRNTAGFVTDPAGDTYVLATTAYPTTVNGVTFGWLQTAQVQARDRNAQLDPRLAGINFVNNGSPAAFDVDLPSPGTYSLSLALGDAGYQQCWVQCQVQFLDGSTVLATLTVGSTQLSYFYDAQGKNWSAAAWPTSNLSQQVTLTGTHLTVVVGTNKATGDFTPIAFLGVTQAQ